MGDRRPPGESPPRPERPGRGAGIDVAPAVPAAPPPVSDVLAQLTQPAMAAGVLTEAEFQTQKARILNG